MSQDPCADLERIIDTNPFQVGQSRWFAHIDALSGVEDCIVAGLTRSFAAADWSRFDRYVLALYRRPSKSGSAVLCEVLGRRIDEVNNEDIVDTLGEIRDPASVPCLADVIWWQPEWDEYHQLAIKAVLALALIGSPEAVRALKDVASSAPKEVRDMANHKLALLSSREQQ
jgi:hypothetical protein